MTLCEQVNTECYEDKMAHMTNGYKDNMQSNHQQYIQQSDNAQIIKNQLIDPYEDCGNPSTGVSVDTPDSMSDDEMMEEEGGEGGETTELRGRGGRSNPPTNRLEEIVRSLQDQSKQQKECESKPESIPNDEACANCTSEIGPIKRDLTYLTHQVYRLMLALRVPTCTCQVCSDRHSEQSGLLQNSTSLQHFATPKMSFPNNNLSVNDLTKTPDGACNDSPVPNTPQLNDAILNPGVVGQMAAAVANNDSWNGEEQPSMDQLRASMEQVRGGRSPSMDDFGRRGKLGSGIPWGYVGRNHKYSTTAEKTTVANYAATYGATAAARKFNISPAVASYYHRKVYNRPLPKGRRPRFMSDDLPAGMTPSPGMNDPAFANGFIGQNGGEGSDQSVEAEDDSYNGPDSVASENYPQGDTPLSHNNMQDSKGHQETVQSIYDIIKSELNTRQEQVNSGDLAHMPNGQSIPPFNFNFQDGQLQNNAMIAQMLAAAGVGGGCIGPPTSVNRMDLNGRGRGRPKLIGDELDARLMDHLMEHRRRLGRRLNVQMVLQIATDFVKKENPGLLQEDGGAVELKQTWAMKLLARLNQAERASIIHNTHNNMLTNNNMHTGTV